MTNTEQKLREIVAKVLLLGVSDVKDSINRKNTETWDSLAHLMLINEVESIFDVAFSDDDIISINTIGDLKQKMRSLGVEI